MTRLLLRHVVDVSNHIVVEGEEFHYLARVRRVKKGDAIEIRDSADNRYAGRIAKMERERAFLQVEHELPRVTTSWPVYLVVAVPKRNLLDDVVRKVSEIGVERVIPVVTQRSVVRPGPAKVERWQRIASESRRQCGREKPLVVDAVSELKETLSGLKGSGTRFILHTAAGTDGFPSILSSERPEPPIVVAIGPEGGFTEAEATMAKDLGFRPACLGASILRVETAAITAAVLSVALVGGY
ncbi:MAG: 16S rRNA (uracil(1498)-N(3))-methyltransferase [Deltaproteobacteria bacterium]|nr:16S rRNA (uracil(1498)-N(3))-methyltransferase [Deltaproteobacteria bacterium]